MKWYMVHRQNKDGSFTQVIRTTDPSEVDRAYDKCDAAVVTDSDNRLLQQKNLKVPA